MNYGLKYLGTSSFSCGLKIKRIMPLGLDKLQLRYISTKLEFLENEISQINPRIFYTSSCRNKMAAKIIAELGSFQHETVGLALDELNSIKSRIVEEGVEKSGVEKKVVMKKIDKLEKKISKLLYNFNNIKGM